jgi:hypothetical protein
MSFLVIAVQGQRTPMARQSAGPLASYQDEACCSLYHGVDTTEC